MDRVQPQARRTEPGQVVQAARQTAQVADPVTIGVLEDVDLDAIDDSFLVPALRHSLPPFVGPESILPSCAAPTPWARPHYAFGPWGMYWTGCLTRTLPSAGRSCATCRTARRPSGAPSGLAS